MHLTFTMSGTAGAESRIRVAGELVTSVAGKEAAGAGLRKAVVTHLEGLGPNKRFPAASTGFYKEAADSTTQPEVTSTGAVISITQQGMRQRLLGGHIVQNTPGKTFLTNPNVAFGYGRLAPEFSGLKFAYARNEEGYLMPALVASDLLALGGGKKRRKKGSRPVLEAGDVVYWLVRSVNQNPDPTILPTDEEMQAAVIEELTDFIASHLGDPNAEVHLSS